MAERLGEALLEIRTVDAGFNQGVAQAEGRAQKLGSTLDKTSGSSARLASEMVATGRSAQTMGAGFEAASQRVTQSAGQQRAGMQQLSFQIGDIATMYSLGARPTQIFASQIGQVTQAVQMMSGGTSRVAAFLGGPWGMAFTAATIVLAPFIGSLFEAEDALKGVEFATDKLGDAQGILGDVIDRTTGKINTQSQALLALARAKAMAGLVESMRGEAEARNELRSISQGGLGDLRVQGTMGGLRVVRADTGMDLVERYRSGELPASAVLQQLQLRMDNGMISQSDALRAADAISGLEVNSANTAIFRDTIAALNGDQDAARRVFGAGNDGTSTRGVGSQRTPRARSGPDRAAIDARFEADLVGITQQILRARLQTATTAEERAELAERGVEWDRRDALAQIERRAKEEKWSDLQRAEFEAATNRLADAKLEAIRFNQRLELARDAEALAAERFRGEEQALVIAGQLADTEAERRDIALRLYDAQVQMERIALQTVIDMAARGEIEKREGDLARQRLANLNANAGAGRAAVARQNETRSERFLRGVNATPGQINEALEDIEIDALDALNDGLTRAIMGAESLGDVFDRVADQIIAALLRIAIQQAIIKPLANSLFGGGGGFLGSLFGGGSGSGSAGKFESAFAGFFATGGTIPTGKFGIVGEEGPELAFAGSGGLGILSNSDSRAMFGSAGGTSVTIPISIDATGADAAAIARVNAQMERLREELPGTIVATVREAKDRRLLP